MLSLTGTAICCTSLVDSFVFYCEEMCCIKLPPLYFFIFLIFIISLCERASSLNKRTTDPSSGCKEVLASFAYVSANFTYCTISNARPITICKDCIKTYLNVRAVYSDILNLKDKDGACKDQIYNLDRLEVVDGGFKYITSLWDKASCNSCFKIVDNCPTTELTPEVSEIWDISKSLETCINEHRNDTLEDVYDPMVCFTCSPFYLNLNDKYNRIKVSTGDIDFCMDVVDMMNSTRLFWSRDLGCCQNRKRPEVAFLVVSSVIGISPLIFYFAAYIFSSRHEERIANLQRLKKNLQQKITSSSRLFEVS